MEKTEKYTMADVLISTRSRKIKNQFFDQVDQLKSWQPVKKIIDKYYKKTNSAVGRPAYSGLSLFKICLLQTWYGLSDYEVEDRINDSLSFGKFIGLSAEECSPDHSTISRFRSLMSKNKVYDKLLNEINKQLASHKIIVKTGVIVDASVVESPYRPKGKPGYEVVEDRSETE
jgi:IS5 family transposase